MLWYCTESGKCAAPHQTLVVHTLVPQQAQVPLVIGLPLLATNLVGFSMLLVSLHLTQ